MKCRLTRHLVVHSLWPRVQLSIPSLFFFWSWRYVLSVDFSIGSYMFRGNFCLTLGMSLPFPWCPTLETRGTLQNLPKAVAGVPRVGGLSWPRVALSPPDSSVLQGKRTLSVLLGFDFLTPTFVSSSPKCETAFVCLFFLQTSPSSPLLSEK